MKKTRIFRGIAAILPGALLLSLPMQVFAQAQASTQALAQTASMQSMTLWDVIINGGFIGMLIWLLLFASAAVTIGIIIDGLLTINRSKIMPPDLIVAVRASLEQGDLGAAVDVCTVRPVPLAKILLAGFHNVSEGFDVIMDSVTAASDLESEKLLQRVNYLNLQSVVAPMLGLMGTVFGMVGAFAGFGTSAGAEKAQLISLSISQALYTTGAGLLIAIPAVIGFTVLRNRVQRIGLEMESLTYDLVKVLRGAEIVEEGEEQK